MTTAADLMTRDLLKATPDMPLGEVAALILDRRLSALPVVDRDDHLLGEISEGDLVRAAETGREDGRAWWLTLLTSSRAELREGLLHGGQTVGDVMSKDVLMVPEGEQLARLIELLARPRVKRLTVVRDGRLIGVVSRVDLLRHLAGNLVKTGRLSR
jgi:CBS domain-containing protein